MRDFNHTVNVLVDAYFKGTLKRSLCQACAVGNIVADATGHELTEHNLHYHTFEWWYVVKYEWKIDKGIKQIEATGYEVNELNRIERAFESGSYDGDPMFNGLMKVVDVLADIHGIDLEAKEKAKGLFVKA